MKTIFKALAFVVALLLGQSAGLAGILPAAYAQAGNVFTDPPKTYPLTQGWYQGRATYYYDFGSNSPALDDGSSVLAVPIYVLVTGFDADGNPQAVPDQRNIIDVVPGDPGYSDLWRVNFVTVPQDYVANTLKSAEDVLNAGYPIKASDVLVNCPVVPLNSSLEEGEPGLTKGWYRGQEVHYFDFGSNTDKTQPIYAFITGFDADGNPQFVAGQHNVIDTIPGDAGYSAFWDVNLVKVPAGYQANSITSATGVTQSGFEVVHAGKVVNCPVVRTDEAMMDDAMANETMAGAATPAAMTNDAMAPGSLPVTGGDMAERPWWLLVAGVVIAGGGWLVHKRLAAVRAR